MIKTFEVKTGKNKGFYIVTTYNKESEEYKRLAQTYGIVNPEYNQDFYRYHKVLIGGQLIWTHTRFAGHEFNRKVFDELVGDLRLLV